MRFFLAMLFFGMSGMEDWEPMGAWQSAGQCGFGQSALMEYAVKVLVEYILAEQLGQTFIVKLAISEF